MEQYREPILAGIYKISGVILGVLGIIGAFLLASESVSIAISAGFAALFLGFFTYGIGQVIDYFGRTAHFTEANHLLLQQRFYSVEKKLQEIDSRIGDRIEFMHSNLREGAQDMKGLRQEIENLGAGPIAQLNWLPHIAHQENKET